MATSIPAPSLAVPASLHASLMARLDRLGFAKEVAQIGAVIGREFSYALLAAMARREEGALQAALDSLTGAGLLFDRVRRRKRLTCSNMPLCRMRLTVPFCASADVGCIARLRKSWRPSSRKSPRASRSCWHVTIPKPVQSKGLPGFGGRRDSDSPQLSSR